jgi:uncharacterized protein (TIGR03435 family)
MTWIERLGATLLHFLWQGIVIAAVYAAARRWIGRARTPDTRYTLACAALAVMIAAPALTWILLRPPSPVSQTASFNAPLSAVPTALHAAPAAFPAVVYRAVPAPFLQWVVAVWFAGALVLWLRLLAGWTLTVRLRSRMTRPAPHEWQQKLNRLKTRIGLSRPVRLLVSTPVKTPVVVGWLRPVVLVPLSALASLSPDQMEAILLHELAHIRRHDYVVNVLQSVVEALLFYHPAVWWISDHIRAERELCCDDVAVGLTGDAIAYARALAELAAPRTAQLNVAAAATGGCLADRIARLLGHPRPDTRSVSAPGTVAALILLFVAAIVVFGQPAERPKFEVAVVKPSEAQSLQYVRVLAGRLTADASVRSLIQNAYGLQAYQIAGGPDSVLSSRYSIEAKADGNAGRDQTFLMLQSLLEDRFQLKTHHEMRDLPVWALVPARSGIKLPPPKAGDCVAPPSDAPPDWNGGRMAPPGSGPPPSARCGAVMVALEPGAALMLGRKVLMPELVRNLSLALGRTVIDKTGYTNLFDVSLKFVSDEVTSAIPPPPPGSAMAEHPDSPSILVALQEQLGLRLESTRGPVDVIVIDHIARPPAN